MSNQVIVSLALLKANWDQSPERRMDYLDYFVPFVIECIRLESLPVVAVGQIQKCMTDTFGLTIPQNVLDMLLNRLAKAGYITEEYGAYKPVTEKVENAQFIERQRDFTRKHDALISSIQRFCAENYEQNITSQEVEDVLLSFLEKNNHMVDVLHSRLRGSVLPETTVASNDQLYLIAKYVEHISKTNPEHFEYLETVVKGLMISNAIFLPDVSDVSHNFVDTQVYIDTPLLIYALGYAGKELQHPCLEMIDLLKESSAELVCFEHSVAEAKRIFSALAVQIGNGTRAAFGPSIEYFLSRKSSSSDILELSEKFQDDLAALGIKVVKKPAAKEDNLMIGEAELENDLKPYANPKALEHDIVSISSIYRLREGREFFKVEECKALFLTNNSRLVAKVRNHFARQFDDSAVTLAMTDPALTNLVWLKQPTKAPTLARDRILADSYAALQPNPELWDLFLDTFEKLKLDGEIDTDRYYALRHATVTKTALMDVTLGEKQAFTHGTAFQIIELATERLKADEAQRANLAEQRATQLSMQVESINKRREQRAQKYAHIIILVAKIIFLLVIAIATIISLPFSFTPFDFIPGEEQAIRWIIGIVFSIFFIASLADIAKGIKLIRYSFSDGFDMCQRKIYTKIYQFLE